MESAYILFKEIKDYFQKVGAVIYALGAVIDSRVDISPDDLQPDKDSKETFQFSSEIYEDVKELAGVLSDEQVKSILDKIEELIFIIPNEKVESTLTSLLAMGGLDGRTINDSARCFGKFVAFTDAGVMNFNQYERLPDNFPDEEKKCLRGVWLAVSKLLKRLTSAVDRIRNADGETIPFTVSYLFPKPSKEKKCVATKKQVGRERKRPDLTVYQTCLYLRHRLGAEQCDSGFIGTSQAEDARILSAMCGGERSGFENELVRTYKDFWFAKDNKEKENEIDAKLAEIKEIVDRKKLK